MIMFTKKCLIKGGNIMQNEFALQITARDSGERVTFERCSLLCEHRSEILNKAIQLGGMVGPTNTHISMPTSESLHKLVKYVEAFVDSSSQARPTKPNVILVTFNRSPVANFTLSEKMEQFKNVLVAQAESCHGIETEYGFDFQNSYDLSLFTEILCRNYLF